ncbi:MAG: sensor histidine kinase [Gammaproteobacteria bacterium]
MANAISLQGSNASANNNDADNCYLPDFGAAKAVFALVLISQLVAVVLSLASDPLAENYFVELARISVLTLWMTLTAACLLTLARPVLARQSTVLASSYSLGLVLVSTALVSEAIYWLGNYYETTRLLAASPLFPQNHWEFLYRNLFIGMLLGVAVLRYFYVLHQWRCNVEREAESRITALQARIRPHFLFNSMNTIASLTRTDPVAAEQAVEDLADLFRASLSNPGESTSLEQELEVARVYQRMEEQRLGDRLAVDWQLDDVPLNTPVPGLTIQPLLENAIYHGIEPLTDGGVITITGSASKDKLTIEVSNPLAPEDQRPESRGHQIALENIRQRLELAYGERARMQIRQLADRFSVEIDFPLAA